jgi:hypothetical protein
MWTPYTGDAGILLLMKWQWLLEKWNRRVFFSSSVVDFKVKVKLGRNILSISSILYFKLIWMDAMYIITESGIVQW